MITYESSKGFANTCSTTTVHAGGFLKCGTGTGFSKQRVRLLILVGVLLAIGRSSTWSQTTAEPSPAFSTVLMQMETAFSNGQLIQKIQLSGHASWYSASAQDSGTVVLTASSDGSSTLALTLSSMGRVVETQSAADSSRNCQRSGSVQIIRDPSGFGCWMPLVWFLPQLTLQPSALLPSITSTYGGTQSTSWGTCNVITSKLNPNTQTSTSTNEVRALTPATLYLDSVGSLPRALTFTTPPSSGTSGSVTEILYSNYQNISGIMIPTHIERYLNGTLELSIDLNNASVLN